MAAGHSRSEGVRSASENPAEARFKLAVELAGQTMEMAGLGPDKDVPAGHWGHIASGQTLFAEVDEGWSVALSQTAHYDGSGIRHYALVVENDGEALEFATMRPDGQRIEFADEAASASRASYNRAANEVLELIQEIRDSLVEDEAGTLA